jgi:DNA repair exonuclease SbcCD ATPase subunit
MLSSGRLAGSQHLDKGKLVWRVHASKEILEKVCVTDSPNSEGQVVDVVDTKEELDFQPENPEGRTWHAEAQSQAGAMAEQFWNQVAAKFMERIELKDQVIGSLRHELEEKDRQLRLLPDLEKRAEEERKTAELKSLEAEALRKQVAALQEEKQKSIQQERELAEESDKKAGQLEREMEQIKAEKEREGIAVSKKLSVLTEKLEKLEQPWWKKWFGQ